jgi:acetylornithine deacetylase/succinyl-diaminopimelate desuccinylase-like protein
MIHVEALRAAIDADWVAEKTVNMVEIPSVTMDEELVCRYFESQLKDLGLEVEVREVTPGRNNLYARIPGAGGGPTLLFNGHLDTIPIGDSWPCRREGDRIYGRGATDMKGGMAAMLGAAKALLQSGVRLRGDVVLTAVVGHEEMEAAKDGPKALIADLNDGRLHADRILIVEGPDKLWVMSMGSMVFRIELLSDKGGQHTQYVPIEQNPIRYVGDLIGRIVEFQAEMDSGERHPLAGAERIDLGIVESGDYFNRTPVRSRLTGTLRWAPGRTAEEALDGLRQLALPFAEAGGLQLEVTMDHQREPFETPIDDVLVRAVGDAHRTVTKQEAEAIGMRIVGDANLYVNGTGVPTIYYGPCNETAHANVEWVSAHRLGAAASVYALAAADFCGVAD